MDELRENLRQLIIRFDPQIKEAGTVDQVEEAILHMEENDENFHRYEMIKYLKRKMEENLGPLVEDEIEKHTSINSKQETLVSHISNSIVNSRHYNEMSKKTRQKMSEAVNFLMENFDAEFGAGRHQDSAEMPTSRKNGQTFIVSDEDEFSIESSINQIQFPSPGHLDAIAEKLRKTRDVATRVEGMQALNQIMPKDYINNETDEWKRIRKHLLDVMADPDERLTILTQKIITRGFTNMSLLSKEIYSLLGDYLMNQFISQRSQIPKVKNGLDLTRPENIKLIKSFRLLNEFQLDAPNYWIRYKDEFLEGILEKTLSLLSVQQPGAANGTSSPLTPVHFMAVIDPKAQWFIKWMHGHYSRSKLLELLNKYKPIVTNAVHHCLEFSASRKMPFDLISDLADDPPPMPSTADGRRWYYTGAELEYAYFLHSVHILGRLLCFVNGRELFPVKIKDPQGQMESVSITKLLVSLVLVVVDPGTNYVPSRGSQEGYEPGNIVTTIMKMLCSSEQVCETCLYKDEITNTLLSPVSQFLYITEHQTACSESVLLNVADIVSLIASTTKGRRLLLYGEGRDMFTKTKSSAAHIIAKFTKNALLGQLPKEAGPSPSNEVIGAFLYICRQLYNTCEGLLVLYPYEIHKVIANAYREACRESDGAATPTPQCDLMSEVESIATTTRQTLVLTKWEDVLRDNLLNFACTAKGILLLQQTGTMNECMSYMYTRYEQKLQVSKCEKFGYGYMVTQVAATSPGMVALQNTGYIKALIAEIWSALEAAPSDTHLFTPKSWPVDPVDRVSHKHLIRLLNVLSSFPAVYEVLAATPLPTKTEYSFRELPSTIAGFMDRLVFVDAPAKVHSLFNPEQSHMFGLRVLSVMTSCLDTFLLLQSQYRFQEKLLEAQADNKMENPGDQDAKLIYDTLSIERNYILVKTYIIGGPTERTLPQRHLNDNPDNPFPHPLFSSYPVPREYMPTLGGRAAMKQDTELSKFLTSKKTEKGKLWLDKCKTIFQKMMLTKPELLRGTVIQQLLEVGATYISKIPEEGIFPLMEYTGSDNSLKSFQLSPLQQLGIKVTIRYGLHLKAIHASSDVTEKLTQYIKMSACFMQQQQRQGADTTLKFPKGAYPGYDWFAATVFLIFGGNAEKSWNFLSKFSQLGCSGYLWLPRLHASVHLPSELMASGISPLFSSTGHNIELILQTELPLVASAFRMSGYTPAQICLHWLKQCFWTYLDWNDICHYLCLCIVMGIDYQVYLCVAILKHLQKPIMEHMQTQDLIVFLKETPVHRFHIAANIKFMVELEKKYRKIILSDMLNIAKP